MSGAKLATGVVAAMTMGGLITAAALNGPAAGTAATPAAVTQASDAPQTIDPRWEIRTRGDSAAPITIFEMSDFQCPWCKLFADSTYPQMDAEYIASGKVQLIFVNLPIPSLHPNAPAAHEFAMCVANQENLWEVHDQLFGRQEEWSTLPEPESFFMVLAEELGVDRDELDICLDSGEMRTLVAADVNTARRAGVTSTPTFVVRPNNGEAVMIPGAVGMDVWRPLLDSLVALNTGG